MYRLTQLWQTAVTGDWLREKQLAARRRFAALDEAELRHLMQLVLDESECASRVTPEFGEFLGTLAAHVGYELWLREQARIPDGACVH